MKDWNSDAGGPVIAGILVNQDRRFLATSGRDWHLGPTGSLPPIPDIGGRMSAFAESTSGMPPRPGVPLEGAKRGFMTLAV